MTTQRRAYAWYVCTCPEHDNPDIPCEGILVYACSPSEALALAWCDVREPSEAVVRREPIADNFSHMALGSAIPKITGDSPESHIRVYRRIGLGPIDNGKRCRVCSLAEWAAVEESDVCEECGICEECHPEEH